MPASTFPSCLIIPAFCSMAKSRSTVCWVTDNVSAICVRHVSAIYTGRVYGKSPASDSSYFVFGLPHCKCTLFSIQFSPFHKLTTNVNFSSFAMKILNKLADADVVVGSCNILNDRRLCCFVLDPVPANSHEKIGELAHCRCCNTLLINYFRNIGPANLFEKAYSSEFNCF